MIYAALAIAVLALIVALVARGTASRLQKEIDDTRAESRRRAEDTTEAVDEKLAVVRRLMAQMAQGAQVTPDMILEGRLWRDASPQDGAKMVAAGNLRILDVRTPQETALGIIPGAQIIPVDELEARLKELPKDRKPMLVYCAGGARSAAACEFLSQKGYENLFNLDGGFGSWNGPKARP
jgi:rhodanese-related sulfurtransferase